jgi:signal transduction histidine kinase
MATTPILIIDDEPAVLEGLREFLEDEGYEVHEAREGEKGLEVFQSVDPDLVMTDLRMPGLSGTELIERIKHMNPHIPIIVVTGYGSLNTAMDAIRLHVFDFITKPIDLGSLKKSLDRAKTVVNEAQQIKREMDSLREQVGELQKHWENQITKYTEVEPLIHTGRLLAGVLHDLNNPLTYIMGQAELLQALHPDVENIGAIKDQALRMKRIIYGITKRMKDAQVRQTEWLQLNTVLQEEVFFLETHPYFRGEIEKEWDLDAKLPLFKGVSAEVGQIFANILRNAAEAMKGKETKRITIRTWHDDSGIYVSVQDSGPGIPPHLQGRIFEPFFSTKTSEGGMLGSMGMGIGLYHCRELMGRYGGHIDVKSSGAGGAVFITHFPRG